MTGLVGQCVLNSAGTMNLLMGLLVESLISSQCQVSPDSMWPTDYGTKVLKSGLQEEFDYVIVGAGSAGSVLAAELSKNSTNKVLVLEEGTDPPQESEVTKLFFTLQNTKYCHNTAIPSNGHSCKAYKKSECTSARGKVLGGTGAINAMLFVRGNRKDYDGWESLGNKGWGYEDVMPIFQKLEQPSPDGYVHLEHFAQYDADVIEMILEGGKELGLPEVEDFVEGSYIGYGKVRGTIKNGRRASTAKTFLAAVQKRDNLKVVKEALVNKLIINENGSKVEAVEFKLQGKKTFTVKAKKEVILSAGAIGSPEILLRSGVGPKELLQSLNIPLVRDLPVGENLQDHVMAGYFIALDSLSDENPTDSLANQLYEFLSNSSGPLSSIGVTSLVGFINSNSNTQRFTVNKSSPYPDIELYSSRLAAGDLVGITVLARAFKMSTKMSLHLLNTIREKDILAIYTMNLHPKSRGSVKITSTKPSVASTLYANYLAETEDVNTLIRAGKFIKSLVETAAFKARNAEIMKMPIRECNVHQFMSDKYLQCYVAQVTMSGYHYAGTVKMGPTNDTTACVDPQLKVKGFDNLRVVDASIMPLITSANTNGPTIMIAKKAADMIAED